MRHNRGNPKPPLYIECQNPQCGKIRQVRDKWMQRRQRFCSGSCASKMTTSLTLEQQRTGAKRSQELRRRKAIEKFVTMSKAEVYRKAYSMGWHSGYRKGWKAAHTPLKLIDNKQRIA